MSEKSHDKSATEKADEAAAARKSQVTGEPDNAETKAAKDARDAKAAKDAKDAKASGETTADGKRVTQAGDAPSGVDLRESNPRRPVEPVREGAEPKTPARGADPAGTPGTCQPGPDDDPVKAAMQKAEADRHIEYRAVVIKRDYWPLDGSAVLKAKGEPTPEDAVSLPIEEARYLEECGIAQSVETYPFPGGEVPPPDANTAPPTQPDNTLPRPPSGSRPDPTVPDNTLPPPGEGEGGSEGSDLPTRSTPGQQPGTPARPGFKKD